MFIQGQDKLLLICFESMTQCFQSVYCIRNFVPHLQGSDKLGGMVNLCQLLISEGIGLSFISLIRTQMCCMWQKISHIWMSGFMRSSFNFFVSCISLQVIRLCFQMAVKKMSTFPRLLQSEKDCVLLKAFGSLVKTGHTYCLEKGRVL